MAWPGRLIRAPAASPPVSRPDLGLLAARVPRRPDARRVRPGRSVAPARRALHAHTMHSQGRRHGRSRCRRRDPRRGVDPRVCIECVHRRSRVVRCHCQAREARVKLGRFAGRLDMAFTTRGDHPEEEMPRRLTDRQRRSSCVAHSTQRSAFPGDASAQTRVRSRVCGTRHSPSVPRHADLARPHGGQSRIRACSGPASVSCYTCQPERGSRSFRVG